LFFVAKDLSLEISVWDIAVSDNVNFETFQPLGLNLDLDVSEYDLTIYSLLSTTTGFVCL
jgi:hypothetical protein